ncbi:aminomethyltransferase family protein [Aestuariivirga sp.]|uniref:aminomethyltransferase family protein n=1 Tax=Aestuariivirga sp. TaxID=2650926 RepID=UPI00359303C2
MGTILKRNVVASFGEGGWNYGIWGGPYHRLHQERGAKYCVYNGRLMAVDQGGDRFEEYWKQRREAGLVDTGKRPTEIVGPDAEAFCNKLFTRNCSTLKPGRAGYGLLLYPDGGILCDGILMRLAPDRFWYVQAEGPVYSWFVAQAQGMNVSIRDPKSWVAQVQGPRALDVLAAASDSGLPENFSYFSVARTTMGGQPVLVSRTGWTGEVGFEFYTLPEEAPVDGEALWHHVEAAGKPFGMTVCGLDSMDIRRIEAGILNNVSDMDETMNPYQAGLGSFVDMRKPDFIGKQALGDADKGILLHGLQCDAGEPYIEGEVMSGGEIIGRVTAAAWSPLLKCGTAIIRLTNAGHLNTAAVTVRTRDGNLNAARIVELPMYDKDKAIPRGLDKTIPPR